MADLRSLHVRARLREDGPGPADRASSSEGDGPANVDARLRRDGSGHAPRAVYPVDHGPERRHHLPGDPQPAAAVRLQAERSLGAQDRLVPHVDGAGRHLYQQLDVPHRHGTQPAGSGDRKKNGEARHQLDGLADGVRASRSHSSRLPTAPCLCPLSANHQRRERSARLGRPRTQDHGRTLPARNYPSGPCAAGAGHVDLWGRLRERHDGGTDCRFADGADPDRELGRHTQQRASLEHTGLVCDPNRARRRLEQNRLCHLVCAERVRAHWMVLANHRDGRACLRVLLLTHYLFASITAHTTAMLPVMLAVGGAIPGMPMQALAQMLVLSGGIMSVLTPYAGGPNPVYYGSGYLPTKDFWLLGAIFGAIFFGLWLAIGTLL